MEKLICPICGSFGVSFHVQKNGFELDHCDHCDLIFVYPRPASLTEIYQRDYFKKIPSNGRASRHPFGYIDYDQDKEPMRSVFVNYLSKFEKLTDGRDIFDVGAATGYFLDLAKARGWQTAGVEISDYAATEARRRGHRIFIGRLPLLEIKHNCNLVTMWDVLEHVEDPLAYIKSINRLLKSKGYLAINTIDIKSFWARLIGKHWHLMIPPEHLYYYSKKSLSYLLEANGFRICQWGRIGKKFSLAYLFKVGHDWQGFKIWDRLSRYFNSGWWRKVAIPFNFRDNIFVLAQKK